MTDFMRARLFQGGAALGCLVLLNVGEADSADYLPSMSSATGKEIARYYRVDNKTLDKELAASDKRACLLDPKEISNSDADRISTLAKTDRAASEVELMKAISPCMRKRGWRIEMLTTSGIDPSIFPAVDQAMTQTAAKLPMSLDAVSELTGLKRVSNDIVYTIRFKSSQESEAMKLRKFYETSPASAKEAGLKLMKERGCVPQPNAYLKAGFGLVYETFDSRGLISTLRLVAADC